MVIKVENLSKVYNSYKGSPEVLALNGMNLSIDKGEFVGIMGASGSGKTTLLNILSGLDMLTSGKIEINNNDITNLSKDELSLFRRQNMGYIFQDFNLIDSLTVEENIALPLILDNVDERELSTSLNQIIEYFSINDLRTKYPYNLSGGQKQKVASSRALINNPAIVFADEPTGNLDSKSSRYVMDLLSQIHKDKNATILLVTHDAFAASFCERIIFMKDGQEELEIVSDGNRRNFFDKILDTQTMLGGSVL